MASSSSSSFHPLLVLCFFFFFFTVNQEIVLGSIILEEGYTVSTILNGYNYNVTPFLIVPQFGSSDLILLDNLVGRFYTLSFSSSEEGVIKKLAGSGKEGYEDGELELAQFNKVSNFAVDFRGNIYVADVHNHKIRKISKTGVTTIAGGYSEKPGNKDGPAQNASFSNDFRLTFVPERCALIISDYANRLIRQINLKAEDCSSNSHSGLEMPSAWALVIGLSGLLLGLVVGFVSRPYIITSRGGMILLPCRRTWNHCLMSLVRRVLMLCFVIRSAVVSLPLYMLLERLALLSVSTISLMFSRTKKIEITTSCKKSSLLDFDNLNSSRSMKADLLKDLISFDEGVESLGTNSNTEPIDVAEEKTNVGSTTCSTSNIDKMVQANLIGFSEQVRRTTPAESPGCNVGLVKRKSVGY